MTKKEKEQIEVENKFFVQSVIDIFDTLSKMLLLYGIDPLEMFAGYAQGLKEGKARAEKALKKKKGKEGLH